MWWPSPLGNLKVSLPVLTPHLLPMIEIVAVCESPDKGNEGWSHARSSPQSTAKTTLICY